MGNNPYESPRLAGESPARKTSVLRRTLVGLFAVAGVVVVLGALLLPGVRSSRGAARRIACINNLRQIAIALGNYEADHHCLPPAYTVDADGKPLHSWRTLILPYLDQKALYEKIDLSKPWNDPANGEACESRVPAYQCPAADLPKNRSTYMAVVAPGGCFQPTKPRKLSEITDDPQLTLMVAEVDPEHAVPWMAPTDASEQSILNLGADAKLLHEGVTQAVCVAGNVITLSARSGRDRLRALISIDGHDDAVAKEAN